MIIHTRPYAFLSLTTAWASIIKDGETSVIENGFWQGTLIYMEIGTGEEIDPNQIVDHRAARRTTFRGLNPLAERSVLVALQRRYKVLST
jgi:hypothetical protein